MINFNLPSDLKCLISRPVVGAIEWQEREGRSEAVPMLEHIAPIIGSRGIKYGGEFLFFFHFCAFLQKLVAL